MAEQERDVPKMLQRAFEKVLTLETCLQLDKDIHVG